MNADQQTLEEAVPMAEGAGLSIAKTVASLTDTTTRTRQRLRILVVEDEPLIGMLLSDMLELMGHEVCAIEATESGAVAAAAKFSPNIMIVDAQLSMGSGISAVDEIVKHGPVAHIFVTGDFHKVHKLRPQAVVLEKPFSEASLTAAIIRACAAA